MDDPRIYSEAELQTARLEAAQLVARSLLHHANNGLAVAYGYALLLAERSTSKSDPELTQLVREIARSIHETTTTLQRFDKLVRLVEDEVLSFPGGSLLDLDASTAP
ncbi:MAG: hypothetical protein HY329_04240 [Chloroflexi bacterium]|nr:hypothetical protein [Chloroflexota bacterium]